MKIRLLWRKYYGQGASNYYKNYITSNNSLQNNGNNKFDKKTLTLSLEQKGALMGLILADGFWEKRKPNHNARLRRDHTYPTQASYVNLLYDLFKNLSGKGTNVSIRKPDKRTNKTYSSIVFKTYNLPCCMRTAPLA